MKAVPERINLVTGNSALLTAFSYAIAILAVAAIATSASPWAWKAGALFSLAAASWFTFRSTPESDSQVNGILNLDGTALEPRGWEEVFLEFTGHAWVSSLFSVIFFRETDSGKKRSWLVCAANNHPDDYRRMLGYLRLGSSGVQGRET